MATAAERLLRQGGVFGPTLVTISEQLGGFQDALDTIRIVPVVVPGTPLVPEIVPDAPVVVVPLPVGLTPPTITTDALPLPVGLTPPVIDNTPAPLPVGLSPPTIAA